GIGVHPVRRAATVQQPLVSGALRDLSSPVGEGTCLPFDRSRIRHVATLPTLRFLASTFRPSDGVRKRSERRQPPRQAPRYPAPVSQAAIRCSAVAISAKSTHSSFVCARVGSPGP